MSSESKYTVTLAGSKSYMPPPESGEIAISTASAGTTFNRVSATSNQTLSCVTFDIQCTPQTALSRNMKINTTVRALFDNLPDNKVLGVNTKYDLDAFNFVTGNLSDLCIAPFGLLQLAHSMSVNLGASQLDIIDVPHLLQNIIPCSNPFVQDKNSSDVMLRPDICQNYLGYQGVEGAKVFSIDGGKESTLKRNGSAINNPFSNESYLEQSRMPPYRASSTDGAGLNSFAIDFELSTFFPSALFNPSNDSYNFFGLDKVSLSLNLTLGHHRLFSVIPKDPFEKLHVKSIEFVKTPELTYNTYTPPEIILNGIKENGEIKPYVIPFPHHVVSTKQAQATPIARGETKSVTLRSFTVQSLPKRLYISMASDIDIKSSIVHTLPADTQSMLLKSCKPRTFARIESCLLKIGNSTSLVGANCRDLLKISHENGLHFSHDQAMYISGAPIVIDLRTDCSLPNMAIGNTTNSLPIDIEITYRNIGTETNSFVAVVVSEYDAGFKYEKSATKFIHSNIAAELSGIRSSEISTSNTEVISRDGIYLGGSSGGGFFETIKNGIGHIADFAVPIAKIVKAVRGGGNDNITGGASIKKLKFL